MNRDRVVHISKKDKSVILERVVKALREDIFRLGSNIALGSEEQLIAQYGVARGTFRKASALLVQEELLSVRRGKLGGYYTNTPSILGVAHSAAVYLRSRSSSFRDIIESFRPLRAEMAILACRNRDRTLRAKLKNFVKQDRQLHNNLDFNLYLEQDRKFGRLTEDLCGNSVLSLYLETLYQFSNELMTAAESMYAIKPERMALQIELRIKLAEAILARDAETAHRLARRSADLAAKWLAEEISGGREAFDPGTDSL